MQRRDVVAIGFIGVLLLLILLAFVSRHKLRGARTECAAHLMDTYVAYEIVRSEQGESFVLQSVDRLRKFEQDAWSEAASSIFRVLCSNGLALVSCVCPRDTRRPASSLGTLQNSNISYFISVVPHYGNAKRILAGTRNLGGTSGSLTPFSNQALNWDPSLGLHGERGYLLLGDGAVLLSSGAELQELVRDPSNVTNAIALP